MNLLPFAIRLRIIAMLVEGASIRATARLCGVNKDTVMYLGLVVGLGCLALHDRLVQGVPMAIGEVDEVWAYVGRHAKRVRATDPPEWGDAYTLFAIDTITKLVPAFLTGRRDLETATTFMHDLRARIIGKPQLSVDGWPQWPDAVRRAFGHHGCDLALILKEYQIEGNPDDPTRRQNTGRVKRMKKRVLYGLPSLQSAGTSIAERLNLTTRMGQRRLARLTNAFSRKRENLRAALGLHFAYYNLVRVHETIKTTPAVRAGIVEAPWSLADLVREALAATPPAPVPSNDDAGDDGPPTVRDPDRGRER